MSIIIQILKKFSVIFKSLGKFEHKVNNYIKYLLWEKRKDISNLNYDEGILNYPLDDEKINKLLPSKLAICVVFFYREEKIDILKKVCKEFNSLAHSIDVTILTNENNEKKVSDLEKKISEVLKNFNIRTAENLQHPQFLPWSHLNIMREKITDNSFTHFMYLEDDIRITRENIIYWINARNALKSYNLIPSFVRTELNLKDKKIYIADAIKKNNFKRMPKVLSKLKNIAFVNLLSPYQAIYFYDKELMSEYFNGSASDPDFAIIASKDQYQGIKERLNFMLTYHNIPEGFLHRTVVPVNLNSKILKNYCLIDHLSNKYANQDSQFANIQVNDLFF